MDIRVLILMLPVENTIKMKKATFTLFQELLKNEESDSLDCQEQWYCLPWVSSYTSKQQLGLYNKTIANRKGGEQKQT